MRDIKKTEQKKCTLISQTLSPAFFETRLCLACVLSCLFVCFDMLTGQLMDLFSDIMWLLEVSADSA